VKQFDCGVFYFTAQGTPGGFVGVRIWENSIGGGTPLVDDYTGQGPGLHWYTPIDASGNTGHPDYLAVPAGTTLIARVYRALTATAGSWDGQNYIDTTVQCVTGLHDVNLGVVWCDSFSFTAQDSDTSGEQSVGYAAVRLWSNGTKIVDSYVAGYPQYYAEMGPGGANGNITFAPQPVGSTFEIRIYRSVDTDPGGWDLKPYFDTTTTCINQIIPLR
jgi:hypothetical protein